VLVLDPALVVLAVSGVAVSVVDVSGSSVLASSAPPLLSSVKAPSSPWEPSELGCLRL
jgi:hypothetical protein